LDYSASLPRELRVLDRMLRTIGIIAPHEAFTKASDGIRVWKIPGGDEAMNGESKKHFEIVEETEIIVFIVFRGGRVGSAIKNLAHELLGGLVADIGSFVVC